VSRKSRKQEKKEFILKEWMITNILKEETLRLKNEDIKKLMENKKEEILISPPNIKTSRNIAQRINKMPDNESFLNTKNNKIYDT
jgi:hypothetical protein